MGLDFLTSTFEQAVVYIFIVLNLHSCYFPVQWYNVEKHALITTFEREEAQKIKGNVDIDLMLKMYTK